MSTPLEETALVYVWMRSRTAATEEPIWTDLKNFGAKTFRVSVCLHKQPFWGYSRQLLEFVFVGPGALPLDNDLTCVNIQTGRRTLRLRFLGLITFLATT